MFGTGKRGQKWWEFVADMSCGSGGKSGKERLTVVTVKVTLLALFNL